MSTSTLAMVISIISLALSGFSITAFFCRLRRAS